MATIQDFKPSADLWYKINVLVWDLRNYEDPKSRERIDRMLAEAVDATYIGLPYFTAEEAQQLKSLKVDGTRTVPDLIQERHAVILERRKAKGSDDSRPCAAHDIAPAF